MLFFCHQITRPVTFDLSQALGGPDDDSRIYINNVMMSWRVEALLGETTANCSLQIVTKKTVC